MVGGDSGGSMLPSLSHRLNALFDRERQRGHALTNNEVAAQLRSRDPALRVSGGYLSALRNGGRTHPSIELLRALSRFFDVPVDHLTVPALDADVATATELVMRERGIRAIALRAEGLNEASMASIVAIIDNVRKLEGLPQLAGGADEAGID